MPAIVKPAPKEHAVPKVIVDAERAVIGSMMIEARTIQEAQDEIKPSDFAMADHARAFQAAVAVFKRDNDADITTVAELLDQGAPTSANGVKKVPGAWKSVLHECLLSVSTAAHAKHYARLVLEASLDRQICKQLIITSHEKTPENFKKLFDLMTAYYSIRIDGVMDFRLSLSEMLDRLVSAPPSTVDLGFNELDGVLAGLEGGDVMTVGARTSGGKTAFMVKAACQLATRGIETLYITTEMTPDQVVSRILPAASGVPSWKFRNRKGKMQDDDVRRISLACADKLSKMSLKIKGKSRVSLRDISVLAAAHKPRVIFFDYLQRADLSESRADNRAYQIMDFMVGLKTLAQDRGMTIIIGCQLDRKLDKTLPEPENSDLKDSGAIESESDQVVLLWRPSEKDLQKEGITPSGAKTIIRAKVSKNRHGAAWERVDFELNGPFVDMCEREIAPQEVKQQQLPMGSGGGMDGH